MILGRKLLCRTGFKPVVLHWTYTAVTTVTVLDANEYYRSKTSLTNLDSGVVLPFNYAQYEMLNESSFRFTKKGRIQRQKKSKKISHNRIKGFG